MGTGNASDLQATTATLRLKRRSRESDAPRFVVPPQALCAVDKSPPGDHRHAGFVVRAAGDRAKKHKARRLVTARLAFWAYAPSLTP